jgi:hypothetical protein
MQLISQNIAGDTPLYNVAYIEELQDSVDSRVARAINKLLASKRNDLALCFNEEAVWKLGIYFNILQNIKMCNSCFNDMDVEEIISLVYNELNRVK